VLGGERSLALDALEGLVGRRQQSIASLTSQTHVVDDAAVRRTDRRQLRHVTRQTHAADGGPDRLLAQTRLLLRLHAYIFISISI